MHDPSDEPGSVLVVARDAERLEAYSETLSAAGFRTFPTSARPAALSRLKDADLAVVEVGRFDTDGWEFIRQIRNRFPSLPLIAITDRADGDLAEQLLEAGVDDHLTWPHRPGALVARARARMAHTRTIRRKAVRTRRRRDQYFQSLLAGSHEIIILVDGDGALRYASPSLAQTLGRSDRELEGQSIFDFIHPDDRALWNALLDGMADVRSGFTGHCRLRDATGDWRTYEFTARDHIANPAVGGIVVNAWDVTDRQAAEQALRDSEARFRLIVEGSRDVFFYVRDEQGVLTYLSPSVSSVLGISADSLAGKPMPWGEDVFGMPPAASTLHTPRTRIARAEHGDGHYVVLELVESPLHGSGGRGTIQGFARDVSERERMQTELREAAFQDGLTSLPNRALFSDRVRHAISRATRNPGQSFAVLFLDLDRFKIVNDSLGHRMGDQLLMAVAERLRQHLRPEDTLARFGGDEFAILLEHVPGRVDAPRVASRIAQTLSAPFHIDGYEIHTSASIGIVVSSGPATSPEVLLQNADMAMYRAKAMGGASFELYDQEMHAEAVRRLELEKHIASAAERDELDLLYSPIVALQDGRVAGLEVMVRWTHPVHGVVPREDFQRLAEETGRITTITAWALDRALEALTSWAAATTRTDLFISIDLSGRQLRDSGIVDQLRDALSRHPVDPHQVKVEVAERLLLEGGDRGGRVLREIAGLGVEILLDEFGSGGASLGHLHSLPLAGVKFERSLLGRLPHDSRAAALVSGVIQIATSFGLATVAGAVENPDHILALRRMGCGHAQGPRLSDPLQLEEVAAFLKSHTGVERPGD